MAFEGSPEKFAPVEVDEVGQIILKARELLSDPAKWCKGAFVSNGAFCIAGAVGMRAFKDEEPLADKAVTRISGLLPPEFASVSTFNDHPSTTHADVLALLDRALSRVESGQ